MFKRLKQSLDLTNDTPLPICIARMDYEYLMDIYKSTLSTKN